MKLLIVFPTRGRRDKFFTTLDKHYSTLSNLKDTHFLIGADTDDPEMNRDDVKDKFKQYENLTVIYGDRLDKVKKYNRDTHVIDKWDIALCSADDFIPQVVGWDDIHREEMSKLYPDLDGALFFNDGHQKHRLNCICTPGRKYYERFNYMLYPGYKSLYCDTEFTAVGKLLGKLKYDDRLLIRHEHPDAGYGTRDYVHRDNSINYKHDRELFFSRQKINFGLTI
jgi:hypothetical protein